MRIALRLLFVLVFLLPGSLALADDFTIVMLPDTQNYVDFKHQKAAGFPFDASALFFEQMKHIASEGVANGGDVVFVAAVGDVWQHLTRGMDPEHARRGIRSVPKDLGFRGLIRPRETSSFEMPTAISGYRLLAAAGIPFGVAPGNHDYDAWWTAPIAGAAPAGATPADLAKLPVAKLEIHIGGLENFKRAFGADSEFFRGKDWYVSAFDGGTSSAQIFSADGYRFLHIALEMQAGDRVLAWAERVLSEHPGLPTIVTTHDYLNKHGERRPLNKMDLALADPGYNNDAETIWRKLISRHDQIVMVLCGHQGGQALRIDKNEAGHPVYQILADYQSRGQSALDAGLPQGRNGRPAAVGDGWYRELTFRLDGPRPRVEVRTYSTYYHAYSSQLPKYVQWYKKWEQPGMSDEEFRRADAFTLDLGGFRQRFAAARVR